MTFQLQQFFNLRKTFRFAFLFICLAALTGVSSFGHEPIVFNENGGWCWFQDERAIINNGKLLFGSVTSNLERTDPGDIVATSYDFETGDLSTAILHKGLQRDDHNAPAFLLRPDGRYLAVFTGHNLDRWIRYRISKEPGQIDEWGTEHGISTDGRVCYSNVYRLEAEGRTYNFYRSNQRTPAYLISDDDGSTWQEGGQLLRADQPTFWPYVRYTSNGIDEIHFITTDAHPNQNAHNNLYHGFIRDGKIHRSDGTAVGDLAKGGDSSVSPSDLTLIFDGDPENIPWTSSIVIDSDGNPHIGYTVARSGDAGTDSRYRYARWDGEQWLDREVAYAGSRLYPKEQFYTGLITLHPDDPNQAFISTDADPVTGEPLISETDGERHWEIFVGRSDAQTGEWNWTPLTRNSTEDNLRPVVASDGEHQALLWMRGTYNTYQNYDCQIVGLVGELESK